MSDSYSMLERRFLGAARRLLRSAYAPVVRGLAAAHVSPNTVSFSQVVVGVVVVLLMPAQPRLLRLLLFFVALALDGIDGALARATGRTSAFGGLFDQYCDHLREVTVVSGLALYGVLNPFLAGLYGLTYPAFNLTLYLCNAYHTPLPFAVKSYLLVYPALLLYLGLGVNAVDAGVGLSLLAMGGGIVQGLIHLRRCMDLGPPASKIPAPD